MSRPSLKITRHDDLKPPGDFSFEVWNPITTRYEPMTSLADGLNRVTDLAKEVRQMWVRHDPALSSLKDAPDPAEDDETEWAEFRVSAQSRLVYEPGISINGNGGRRGTGSPLFRRSATRSATSRHRVPMPNAIYAAAISLVARTGSFSTLHKAVRFASRGRTRSVSQK